MSIAGKPTTPKRGTASVRALPSRAFEIVIDREPVQIDFSYRGIKSGVEPSIIRKLEVADILERGDVARIITKRTLERRLSNNEALNVAEADGIARLLRVIAHAERVFEDEALAEEWLRSPNPALDDEIPMVMAATDVGAREVEGVLTRLEYGIFD